MMKEINPNKLKYNSHLIAYKNNFCALFKKKKSYNIQLSKSR